MYFVVLLLLSLLFYLRPNKNLENLTFISSGFLLIAFTATRPLGLAIDDLAYIEISQGICAFSDCMRPIQSPRDYAWYTGVGVLKSLIDGPQAILILASLGLTLQLYVIYKLCNQKILALAFFVPHIYLLFDFTIFRAGFALSFYFLAIYLLVSNRKWLGTSFLVSNFLFHSQGIFSVGLLPMRWLARRKTTCIMIAAILLAAIYFRLTPNIYQLAFLVKTEAAPYLQQALNGEFIQNRSFPRFGLLLIIFMLAVYILREKVLDSRAVNNYVLGSTMLALFLAWFFAPITLIQLRLFDFYMAPLVFLVGNLKRNIWSYWATSTVAILLFIRLVFINNFILG
jgi:hypothetical protein